MAGLVLELIKFLPALSADSSFLHLQKWPEEWCDGEGEWTLMQSQVGLVLWG